MPSASSTTIPLDDAADYRRLHRTWNQTNQAVHVSMPSYVTKSLAHLEHPADSFTKRKPLTSALASLAYYARTIDPSFSQSLRTFLPSNSKHPQPSTRRLTSHEPSTRRTASHVRGCVDTPTVNQALTHVASTVNQTLSPLYPEVHSMDDMFQQSLTH